MNPAVSALHASGICQSFLRLPNKFGQSLFIIHLLCPKGGCNRRWGNNRWIVGDI